MSNLFGYERPAYNVGRNKIINGAMSIDQRLCGAVKNMTSATWVYTLDRFAGWSQPAAGVYTMNQAATTPPPGFFYYLHIQTTTTNSGNFAYFVSQQVEGPNVIDMNLGTPLAKPFVLSFWVRSSLTGTFGGGFNNYLTNRSYVFTYTINNANTWEYKTIPIVGDQTGTWSTALATAGIRVNFDIGSGSSYQGTAGVWGGGFAFATASSVKLLATNGATLDITGLQLELGTEATAFENRSLSQELLLCQRYCQKSYPQGAAPGSGTGGADNFTAALVNTTTMYCNSHPFIVDMATSPTMTIYLNASGTSGQATWISPTNVATNRAAIAQAYNGKQFLLYCTTATEAYAQCHWIAEGEI